MVLGRRTTAVTAQSGQRVLLQEQRGCRCWSEGCAGAESGEHGDLNRDCQATYRLYIAFWADISLSLARSREANITLCVRRSGGRRAGLSIAGLILQAKEVHLPRKPLPLVGTSSIFQ